MVFDKKNLKKKERKERKRVGVAFKGRIMGQLCFF
jgi:hypothetical protein